LSRLNQGNEQVPFPLLEYREVDDPGLLDGPFPRQESRTGRRTSNPAYIRASYPNVASAPLQHRSVADNTFAVIPVIGVSSAISVVAGARNYRYKNSLVFAVDLVVA
jgi:hypothetical protein